MNSEQSLRRAQVYGFLSGCVPYPAENWLDDGDAVADIMRGLGDPMPRWAYAEPLSLDALQEAHRLAFGATGSLCYETEYGLPHEFRQSQEMADIAGFYRAFGFDTTGPTHERPDYLGAELEFMCVLALKEANARARGMDEQVEICVDAQRKFVQDHLGQWINLFAQGLAHNVPGSPYTALGRFAADFVAAEAARLGAQPEARHASQVLPTPLAPDLSCEACPAMTMQEDGGDES